MTSGAAHRADTEATVAGNFVSFGPTTTSPTISLDNHLATTLLSVAFSSIYFRPHSVTTVSLSRALDVA